MFSTILWATDGSPTSDGALPRVRELAARDHSRIIVFHVQQRMVGPYAYGYPVYADEHEVVDKVRRQAAALSDEGWDSRAEVVPSNMAHLVPAADIVGAADHFDADLIVMGSRGHTALGGLLLGSATQRVLHMAHCPVLVVPPPALGAVEVASAVEQAQEVHS